MKKILFLSILFLSLVSCEKIDKKTQFSVDYSTSFQMPADMTTQTPVDLGTFSLIWDNNIFDDYKTSKDLIDNASLKTIVLEINDNASQNFNFLKGIEIYLKADGLPTLRIAWKNILQNLSENSLQLEHLSDNLSEYFKKDKVQIKIMTINDAVLSEPVDINVKISVYIDAQLLGN